MHRYRISVTHTNGARSSYEGIFPSACLAIAHGIGLHPAIRSIKAMRIA